MAESRVGQLPQATAAPGSSPWRASWTPAYASKGRAASSYDRYSNNMPHMAMTTVQLDTKTRDLLKAMGRKGETYDSIIRKLLRSSEYVDFMEEQYGILRTEKHWVRLKGTE